MPLTPIVEPDPNLDMLAKLYTLYSSESVTFSSKDEIFLTQLSDSIYALDDPSAHQFSIHQQQTLEKLWKEYVNE